MKKSFVPVLALTAGDPAGVGPEIALKAAFDKTLRKRARMVLVGEGSIWEKTAAQLGFSLKLIPFSPEKKAPTGRRQIEFVECPPAGQWNWGEISASGGRAAYNAIEKAVELVQKGHCHAIVTTPLNKESLRASGVSHIGHTEILAHLTNAADPLTVFLTGKLCVFFYTRHLPLSAVSATLTVEGLAQFALRCQKTLQEWGIARPRLAIAGFNPHCGEHGLLGDEEVKVIQPAVKAAMGLGVDLVGPIGADSVFAQGAEGRYDAVISLYHDQGHIACKTLDFHGTVSLTAGLPLLRLSVDHGTAFDIAGEGKANATGMKKAVMAAVEILSRKNAP